MLLTFIEQIYLSFKDKEDIVETLRIYFHMGDIYKTVQLSVQIAIWNGGVGPLIIIPEVLFYDAAPLLISLGGNQRRMLPWACV